jgi:hypothetical protein
MAVTAHCAQPILTPPISETLCSPPYVTKLFGTSFLTIISTGMTPANEIRQHTLNTVYKCVLH